MAHHHVIFPDQELIVAFYIGHTTVADMRKLAEDVWNDPTYNRNFRGILDYREATLSATPKEIKEMADFFLQAAEASNGNAAILATGPTETALNEIFARRMAARNDLRVFSTWNAACAFIGITDLPDPMG